jgi:hypothetical protein
MKNAVFRDVAPCGFVRSGISDGSVSSIFRTETIRDREAALAFS